MGATCTVAALREGNTCRTHAFQLVRCSLSWVGGSVRLVSQATCGWGFPKPQTKVSCVLAGAAAWPAHAVLHTLLLAFEPLLQALASASMLVHHFAAVCAGAAIRRRWKLANTTLLSRDVSLMFHTLRVSVDDMISPNCVVSCAPLCTCLCSPFALSRI